MVCNVLALVVVAGQIQGHVPGWNLGTNGMLVPSGQDEKGYSVGVDPFELYGDSPSLTIASNPGAPYGWRAASQMIRADHYRGKRVRFRARVKTHAVTGQSGIWLRVDLPVGDELSMGSERRVVGTVDWTSEQAVFDVPNDAVAITFGSLLMGTGQVWVADMKLDVVGHDVPLSNPADPMIANPNATVQNLSLKAGAATTLPGWRLDKGSNVKPSPEGFRGGAAAVLDGSHEGSTLYQTVSAAPYLGRRIRFSSMVRTAAVGQQADVFMDVYGSHGQELAWDDGSPARALKGDRGWARLTVVLDVPRGAKIIVFGCAAVGGGRAWMSDTRLEPVPKSVASTQIVVDTIRNNPAQLKALPTEPVNLSLKAF